MPENDAPMTSRYRLAPLFGLRITGFPVESIERLRAPLACEAAERLSRAEAAFAAARDTALAAARALGPPARKAKEKIEKSKRVAEVPPELAASVETFHAAL